MTLRALPNVLTVIRILLVLPFIALLWQGYNIGAFWLFVIAGATDAIDGFLARHFNCLTRFGSIADPIADKCLMLSAFVMLTYLHDIPLGLLLVAMGRDLIIVGGGLAYHYRVGPFTLAPSLISKINTFFQLVLITVVLGAKAYGLPLALWVDALIAVVYVTNILSLCHYIGVWSRKAWQHQHKGAQG